MHPAELREYIDHMRGSVGWSYGELAKKLSLTRDTLYKYMTGIRTPRDWEQLAKKIRQAVVIEQRKRKNEKK